jgi:hypothetical protein
MMAVTAFDLSADTTSGLDQAAGISEGGVACACRADFNIFAH